MTQHIRYLTWLLPVVLFLSGCSLSAPDDPRDLCCEDCEGTLHYRYVRYMEDEYEEFVSDMRHFVFDGDDLYLTELESNPSHPQDLSLRPLPDGSYTIVTLGNLDSNPETAVALLSSLVEGETRLADLRLDLRDEGPYHTDVEQLFWNVHRVDLAKGCMEPQVCDLANIHCHLYYTIVWESVPPYPDGYRVTLSGLSDSYILDPDVSDLSIEVNPSMSVTHHFPLHDDTLTQAEDKPKLFNHKLEGEFISLRYLNDRIPTLRIWHGDEELTRPIDLSIAFDAWGWIPDRRAEQIYKIYIVIKDDGSAVVSPNFDISVEDWQPGGTVVQ